MAKILQIKRSLPTFCVTVRGECVDRADGVQFDAVEDANFATKEAADAWCSALNSRVGFSRYQVQTKSG